MKTTVLLLGLLALTACAGSREYWRLPKDEARLIEGMSTNGVRAAIGSPDALESPDGRRETWTYFYEDPDMSWMGASMILYFADDRLAEWETRPGE